MWDPLGTSGFVGFLEKVKMKGGPFGVFRFCRLRKKGEKRKGEPFAVSLHWSNLA